MKELKMFIDGRFIENESGKWIKVLNPSTEEVISLMPDGTVEDARKAIDAAEKAQNQWERTPSIERAAYLTKIRKLAHIRMDFRGIMQSAWTRKG